MTFPAPVEGYASLTKSIDVDEAMMLIRLSQELPDVRAWQEEALYRLPQPSRQRRQEITRSVQRMFLLAESQRFVRTPLVELLNDATLPDQLKRDLLFAQYLRATPLVWPLVHLARSLQLPATGEFQAKASGVAAGPAAADIRPTTTTIIVYFTFCPVFLMVFLSSCWSSHRRSWRRAR